MNPAFVVLCIIAFLYVILGIIYMAQGQIPLTIIFWSYAIAQVAYIGVTAV